MALKLLSKLHYNKFCGIVITQRFSASVDSKISDETTTIRETGAQMGITEGVEKDGYFQVESKRLLEIFRNQLKGELFEHECQIRLHDEAIERHRRRILNLQQLISSDEEPK